MSSVHSTSRTSIYEYPEHLNPFYEDEQHKRLRFWKVSHSSGKPGGRRLSFNLGSIRNLLPFESFRLKKKSSTLGVNKTSESPTSPRRIDNYNSYANYDSHLRRQGSMDFQRNTPCRSSLQTLNDFSFTNRNNRYRSTIQSGTPYRSNETPRSLTNRRANYLGTPSSMTPGSSMNSVNTNPFEENDNDFIVSSLPDAKGYNDRRKKKRRAPLPPVLSSTTVTTSDINDNNEKVTIRESSTKEEDAEKGLQELSRMTAEFESFIKNSQKHFQNDSDKILREDILSEKNVDSRNQENHIQESGKGSQMCEEVLVVREVEESPIQVIAGAKKEEQDISPVMNLEINVVSTKTRQFPETDRISSSTSREETPDYIPVPVKEKFQTVENIENKETQNMRVVQKEIKADVHIYRNGNDMVVNRSDDRSNEKEVLGTIEQEPRTEIYGISNRCDDVCEKEPKFEIKEVKKPVLSYQDSVISNKSVVNEKEAVFKINEKEIPTPSEEGEELVVHVMINNSEEVEKVLIGSEISSEIKENPNSPNTEVETAIKPLSKPPIIAKKPTLIPRKHFFRDDTPVPIARTEIEAKLSSQGFVRVNEQIIKRDDDDGEVVIRKKEEIDESDLPSKPTRKRRSVKEIIESINRNQLLLKVNQPSSPTAERRIRYTMNNVNILDKPVIKVREGAFIDPRIDNYNNNEVNNDSSPKVHQAN